MKVFVRGELIDSEKEPVFIVFDTDGERTLHARNMTNMPEKEKGIRIYSVFPKDSLSDEQFDGIVKQIEVKNK